MAATDKPKFKKLQVTDSVDFSAITSLDLAAGLIDSAMIDPTLLGGLLGSGDVTEATAVTLTATQIRAVHTTPITLVAQPASGYAIIVDEVRTLTTFGTAAFTGANNVEFRYTDGSGDKVAADLPVADLNIVSGTKNYRALGASVIPIRAAVVVVVPVADPGANTATGTLKIIVRYHTVSLS